MAERGRGYGVLQQKAVATFCQLRFVALLSRVSFFLWLYNLAWGKFSALCCATHKGESRGGERVQGEGVEMLTTTLTFAVRVALSLFLYLFLYLYLYLCICCACQVGIT